MAHSLLLFKRIKLILRLLKLLKVLYMSVFGFLIRQRIVCLRFCRLKDILFKKLFVFIVWLHIIIQILQSVIRVAMFHRLNEGYINLVQWSGFLQWGSYLLRALNGSRGTFDFHRRDEHAIDILWVASRVFHMALVSPRCTSGLRADLHCLNYSLDLNLIKNIINTNKNKSNGSQFILFFSHL